jgi:hypothetical protein
MERAPMREAQPVWRGLRRRVSRRTSVRIRAPKRQRAVPRNAARRRGRTLKSKMRLMVSWRSLAGV